MLQKSQKEKAIFFSKLLRSFLSTSVSERPNHLLVNIFSSPDKHKEHCHVPHLVHTLMVAKISCFLPQL